MCVEQFERWCLAGLKTSGYVWSRQMQPWAIFYGDQQ